MSRVKSVTFLNVESKLWEMISTEKRQKDKIRFPDTYGVLKLKHQRTLGFEIKISNGKGIFVKE